MKAMQFSKEILVREIALDRAALRLIGVVGFIILTALGAFVRLPLAFTPVPVTLQTFFVFLSGALLTRRLGAASQLGYVFLGILGLPIFTGAASGMAALCGPTGGYLIGFICASWVIAFLRRRFNATKTTTMFLIMCVGIAVIYLFGGIWLKTLLHLDLTATVQLGMLPFLPGDLAKAGLASILYAKIQKRTTALFG
ncbi:MAG: biotin transporter BioY [Candidatus Omnitrophota bacterium]